MFKRLTQGLQKTRQKLAAGLGALFLGKKVIDADLLDELEAVLISADIGMSAVQKIMKALTEQISRHALDDSKALLQVLQKNSDRFIKAL